MIKIKFNLLTVDLLNYLRMQLWYSKYKCEKVNKRLKYFEIIQTINKNSNYWNGIIFLIHNKLSDKFGV